MRRMVPVLAVLVVWLCVTPMAWAQKDEAKEHAELAKAMKDAVLK